MTDWLYDHAADPPPGQIPGFFVPPEGYCTFSRVMTDNGQYGTRMDRPMEVGYDTGGISISTSGTLDGQVLWITGEARTNWQSVLGGFLAFGATHWWDIVADEQWHRFLANCKCAGDDGDAQLWANVQGGPAFAQSGQYVEFRGITASDVQPPFKVVRIWAPSAAGNMHWHTGLKIRDGGYDRWLENGQVWDGSTLIDVI